MRLRYVTLRDVAQRDLQIAENAVHFLLRLQFFGFAHQFARQVRASSSMNSYM